MVASSVTCFFLRLWMHVCCYPSGAFLTVRHYVLKVGFGECGVFFSCVRHVSMDGKNLAELKVLKLCLMQFFAICFQAFWVDFALNCMHLFEDLERY